MPELSVILVNYKRPKDTIECIDSLLNSSFKDINIIVVENGSGDGSGEKIRRAAPSISLIKNPTNVGFAEGNNLGIRAALVSHSKFILLLNNDTIVDPDALKWLLSTMDEHQDAGIVGAKIFYFDKPDVLWFAGGYFNPYSAFGGHYGIGELDSAIHNRERTCTLITGCCLLFRREVALHIGLLDSDYFAYLEDADFCVRTRRSGYALYYQPHAVLYHKVSSTSAWDSPAYIYFNLRNKIFFLRKNANFHQWFPSLPRLVYFYVRQFVRLALKWRDIKKTRAALYGLVDGLRNYTGEFGKGRLNQLLD